MTSKKIQEHLVGYTDEGTHDEDDCIVTQYRNLDTGAVAFVYHFDEEEEPRLFKEVY